MQCLLPDNPWKWKRLSKKSTAGISRCTCILAFDGFFFFLSLSLLFFLMSDEDFSFFSFFWMLISEMPRHSPSLVFNLFIFFFSSYRFVVCYISKFTGRSTQFLAILNSQKQQRWILIRPLVRCNVDERGRKPHFFKLLLVQDDDSRKCQHKLLDTTVLNMNTEWSWFLSLQLLSISHLHNMSTISSQDSWFGHEGGEAQAVWSGRGQWKRPNLLGRAEEGGQFLE